MFVESDHKQSSSITKMRNLGVELDRFSLVNIVSLWIFTVLVFTLIFFALSQINDHQLLINGKPLTANANGLGQSVYFSFITATTIGFSDYSPQGISKVFTILEVILSITLFLMVFAKIVTKRDKELHVEIQELSFEEKSNTAISHLYIYRNDLQDINKRIESAKKNEIKNIMSDFENTNSNLKYAVEKFKETTTITEDESQKKLKIELLANSVNFTLKRLAETVKLFTFKKVDWKKESIAEAIKMCEELKTILYDEYSKASHDTSALEKLEDLDKTLKELRESLKA